MPNRQLLVKAMQSIMDRTKYADKLTIEIEDIKIVDSEDIIVENKTEEAE
jgi:hypothetical protein